MGRVGLRKKWMWELRRWGDEMMVVIDTEGIDLYVH